MKNNTRNAGNSAGKSLLPSIVFIVFGLLLQNTAQAAIYEITAVLDGGGGFGASLFHNASGGNPMSGTTVVEIDEIAGSYGLYNSGTGALTATGLQLVGGGSFDLTGNLVFTGTNGELGADSTLAVDFTGGPGAPASDTTLGFNDGYVCCGNSDQDPNSFNNGSGPWVMTLWGANFTGTIFDGSYPGATLGMDLRLKLELVTPDPIPLPAAAWLFGSALLGLAGIAKRKQA